MFDQSFQTRLDELLMKVRGLPSQEQGRLAGLIADTQRRHEQIALSATEAFNALADWRIAMKYLIFDREATMRENRRGQSSSEG